MSFKCVKMFCSPPIMYISLMNSVSTEHPVYLFSQASSYVPLSLGREPAFYQGEPAATHAFVPCGHVCSEETVRYGLKIISPLPLNL